MVTAVDLRAMRRQWHRGIGCATTVPHRRWVVRVVRFRRSYKSFALPPYDSSKKRGGFYTDVAVI